MSEMLELFEGQTASAELAKEAGVSDLIPGGKYPFLVTAATKPELKEVYDDGNKNPLFGHPVGRVEVTLFGVGAKGPDELDGRDRKFSFNVTPVALHNEKGRLLNASKLAGDMTTVSGLVGRPFNEVIQWFMENRAELSVGQFKGGDGSMRNIANKISKLAA
jgi:hypothetical protein